MLSDHSSCGLGFALVAPCILVYTSSFLWWGLQWVDKILGVDFTSSVLGEHCMCEVHVHVSFVVAINAHTASPALNGFRHPIAAVYRMSL